MPARGGAAAAAIWRQQKAAGQRTGKQWSRETSPNSLLDSEAADDEDEQENVATVIDAEVDEDLLLARSWSGIDEEHLVEKLRHAKEHRKKLCKRIADGNTDWESKRGVLKKKFDEHCDEEQKLLQALENHLRGPEDTQAGPVPPGPAGLLFVDGDAFMLLGLVVVIANTATIIMEVLQPDTNQTTFFILNTLFMVWYAVEFALKFALWRYLLLCGSPGRVWWNWLDMVILISGLLDMLPGKDLTLPGGTPLSTMVRPLRLARLARLLKLVMLLDFSFTEGERFQVFIMAVIAWSSLMMGLEDSYPELTTWPPPFGLWPPIENLVLCIFLFELVARLQHYKWAYFCNKDVVWNWLDLIIVLGGVTDMWMMPTIAFVRYACGEEDASNEDTGDMGGLMMLLRMARLLRILRLARLIRRVPSLYKLLQGIRISMQGVTWVLVLVMLLLYAIALVLVKVVRGCGPSFVVEALPSVWECIFVLFEIMNGHEGHALAQPLFQWREEFKLFFALFVVASSWGVLSILTAVVSDDMLSATKNFERDAEAQAEDQSLLIRRLRLEELFRRLDINGSDNISKQEFAKVLSDDEQSSWVCKAAGSGLDKQDIEQLTEILDRDDFIHKQEFVKALEQEGSSPRERSMMKLETAMHKLEAKVIAVETEVRDSRREVGTISKRLRHELES